MTWLVTGGAGYIGSHVVNSLIQAELPVALQIAADIDPYTAPPFTFHQQKKTTAKKSTAKKSTSKKVAKKSVEKSVKRPVRKSASSTTFSSSISVPPVPVSTRPTAPSPVAFRSDSGTSAPRPAIKRRRSNGRFVIAIFIGIIAIGAIVLSKGSNSSNDDSSWKPAATTPAATDTAMPTETASDTATPTATATSTATATATATPTPTASATATATATSNGSGNGVAPLGIVAHYTSDGADIFWKESLVTNGLKGYSIEIRSNNGAWNKVGEVPVGTLKYNVKTVDTSGWSAFRISALYSDGQVASGKVFGLPGQYK